MVEMTDPEMDHLVELVRKRAEVPRVRSSEVRKVIQAMLTLSNEGETKFRLVATS